MRHPRSQQKHGLVHVQLPRRGEHEQLDYPLTRNRHGQANPDLQPQQLQVCSRERQEEHGAYCHVRRDRHSLLFHPGEHLLRLGVLQALKVGPLFTDEGSAGLSSRALQYRISPQRHLNRHQHVRDHGRRRHQRNQLCEQEETASSVLVPPAPKELNRAVRARRQLKGQRYRSGSTRT